MVANWVSALLPRRLPLRSFAFDVGLGLILTPYLFLAAFGLHPHLTDPAFVYLLEGIAVACRRVWLFFAAALILVVSATAEVTQWPYPIGVGIVIFTMATRNTPRVVAWAYTLICTVLLILETPFSSVERNSHTLGQIIPESVLVTIGPLFIGLYTRERQGLIAALTRQAAEAERRRVLEAERIRADERSQLANEIHDVVAHTVSLMVVHTGALTLAATDDRTRELAEHVREAGSTALEELRDLVGVLRKGDSAPLGPTPSVDNLAALIEESRAAGAEIELFESGRPSRMPGPVERTTYRLIQESLTNARKHAPGAHITVHLTWAPDKVVISVHNDLPTGRGDFPTSGHGMKSLRERVGLLSGQFSAGPTADGGWTVSATLPLGGGE